MYHFRRLVLQFDKRKLEGFSRKQSISSDVIFESLTYCLYILAFFNFKQLTSHKNLEIELVRKMTYDNVAHFRESLVMAMLAKVTRNSAAFL